MKGKKILSTLLALLLLANLPVSALAAEWDIGNGDITVNAGSGGQTVTQGSQVDVPDSAPVITGSSTDNTLTINAEKDQTASVTLSGADIDVSGKGKAAVSTTGEGNVSIELDGENTLKSATNHAGLEKNNGGSLTIADEDKNGKLTAEGGIYGAGIGGGYEGEGSNIAITGGEVEATGGIGGAGIGGGKNGAGSSIAITGGEVKATGGKYGAGVGGGLSGNGNHITITGGEVKATGGLNGAGIGGGLWGKGQDITISGDAQLKVQGGVGDYFDGPGAGIGDGGSRPKDSTGGNPIPGTEVEPDTSGLTTNGSIEYYAPGADMEKDKPEKTTVGTLPPQEKPVEPIEPIEPAEPEQPEAEHGMDAPLYRVTDQDGKDIAHKAERKDGVLTVTVDADFAILTGKLSSINTLKRQGIEKIVFVTNKAASTFQAADLLEKGASSDAYRLTHDGATVTFVVSEKKTDVSGILIQP